MKWGLGLGLAMAVLIACGEHHTVLMDGKTGDGKSTNADGGEADGGGGTSAGGTSGKLPKDAPPCLVSEVTAEVAVSNVDKVDMLFMVDNSNSMREEQGALRSQFAHLIQVLATGDRDGDGESDVPPVKDIHLGVVTSDMGLLGIEGIDNCSGFGDDGILQHFPSPDIQGCQASYPSFLSYVAGVNDPNATANDFACIATVGTGGCGFEQPLESALKALWPSMDPMAGPGGMNRITFLGDAQGNGLLGHGDTDNLGFLRNDPTQGLSLIAIVVVTDEEDCSSSNTKHFTPPTFLDMSDPLVQQPLNLRCFFNEKNQNGDELYKIERYINGYKALRPGNENLVVFAAITGVPPDLVVPEKLNSVDFTDSAQRDAFYSSILNDNRMQEMVDPASTTTPGTGNLIPSCNTDTGKAYPPRRIVEVARQFGENGIVQSICQQDFGPAMDAITGVIQKQLGAVCLPRMLSRNSAGTVGCEVYWELPLPDSAPANIPTECGQSGWEFLLEPDAPHVSTSDRGGAVCKVAQLAVKQDSSGSLNYVPTKNGGHSFDDGWYYDDFSESTKRECTGGTKQRIAFSPKAKPPTGITVKLECSNQTPIVPARTDIATNVQQPQAGSACDQVELNGQTLSGDAACAVRLIKPTKKWPDQIDKSMFCHPETNQCVLECNTNDDCPPDWICDASADAKLATNGKPFCTVPSCSGGSKIASAAHVGDACLPMSIPEGGFDDREAYLATSDDASCGGGVCLVYHLKGDPRESCIPSADSICSDPAEVEGRVYCSCRCDGPDGYAKCGCPSGFACQDVLEQGGDAFAGSYCVRNGI